MVRFEHGGMGCLHQYPVGRCGVVATTTAAVHAAPSATSARRNLVWARPRALVPGSTRGGAVGSSTLAAGRSAGPVHNHRVVGDGGGPVSPSLGD